MNNENFLSVLESRKKNLVNLDVNRVYNSIGSNVFFEFGEEREVVLKNGRKRIKKDWTIWIDNASWRITQNNRYVIGFGDPQEMIVLNIQKLLGKTFQSLHFLSQFLDIKVVFAEGYELTTFFNWAEESQWTIFLPDERTIDVDCSGQEKMKNVQALAKELPIIESLKTLALPQENEVVTDITFNRHNQPSFHFGNKAPIEFLYCMWRLEKDNDYVIGFSDDNKDDFKTNLAKIIGKKLVKSKLANSMIDAVFEFEDRYTLKTFTSSKASPLWKAGAEFSANIDVL